MDYQPMPAIFIADAPGLDFLNSVATPVDVPVDWIDSGEGLLSWLAQARLVPAEVLDEMRAHAAPGQLDAVAAQARELREWFRGFVKQHRGKPLSVAALAELAPVQQLLARDESFNEVVAKTDGASPFFELQKKRRWHAPESLLLPIAEILARLVCDEDFTHVKACEGPACTLMFADHTRGHARRWCSMAICGNRAKVAAHRKRQKEKAETAQG
ncbi:MAG TPA: CGNR zinc finger domain-containing protein [Paraburkholderia sp.]|jgi:predicted RNA-binding Zn ribbon-like protein|nr:CGNR zinc finger domain-containing protein [Paraburkholderia sp.]